MKKAKFKKYVLEFKQPSGTSRGILKTKDTYFISIVEGENVGIGEAGLLKGLSIDDVPDYEEKLQWCCDNINLGLAKLYSEMKRYPSIQFGLEQAFLSFSSKDTFHLFPSDFTNKNKPISINGLIWMGTAAFMKTQIEEKLAMGFSCIKMKIGAIDFSTELNLLRDIRARFSADQITLRVDANGAFLSTNALEKLQQLAKYELHSIEQPIQAGNQEQMKVLCSVTPLPIALDEELIGVFSIQDKEALLKKIKPQYIILKPSLIGGFQGTKEWIMLAEKYDVSWWITSALESNVGLNAISQFTYTLQTSLPQGLGTGSLYTNNIDSPLTVTNGKIIYDSSQVWDTIKINEVCI